MKSRNNKFCEYRTLRNESDVEQFLVHPLLIFLGYTSSYLKTKTTLPRETIGKGSNRKTYVPDYLGYTTKRLDKPVIVVDAKHPNEPAEQGVLDAQFYASVLRRRIKEPKPGQFCIGCNGNRLLVRHYDSDVTLHSLDFDDLKDGNSRFTDLVSDLSRSTLSRPKKFVAASDFDYRNVEPSELPAVFESCHRAIWKAEKRSPASAFYEFAKVMFVKIDEDRRLRETLDSQGVDWTTGKIPAKLVRFSTQWIDEMSQTTESPLDTILFAELTKRLEDEIARGSKKRIFDQGERIDLSPDTIRDTVEFLEHLDLFSVDEDLNGRLFETFLTATMRGSTLGQFFTPRSVVKFMVQLADLSATRKNMERVLDGCCGSGGFLIEAMASMSSALMNNESLTTRERSALMKKLRTEKLWGIDAGKDPKMAQIARLNMLLHKDGGSRIYFTDALDKSLRVDRGLPLPSRLEIEELKRDLIDQGLKFSCVLTNPPFAMTYERKKPRESEVLQEYTLSLNQDGRPRAKLKSAVMFLERYWDLLEGDGRLLTVMDESVLNTISNQPFREYLLHNFIIRAVISLPKNTFVKAQGSVKTSVLCLRKKADPSESQPPVFMALCGNVGHSDSGKEHPQHNELPKILEAFRAWESAGKSKFPKCFTVTDLHRENSTVRLDAPYFNPHYFKTISRLEKMAVERSWSLCGLESLLENPKAISGGATPKGALYPDVGPKFIRVQNVRPYELVWTPEDACIDYHTHHKLKRSQLHHKDVVLTITGSYGIAAIVPKNFGEANINQHSVKMTLGQDILPEYLVAFLNSKLCRPQFDRAVTGSSRLALDYPSIRNLQVLIPQESEQKEIIRELRNKLKRAHNLQTKAISIYQELPEMLS